MKNSSKWASRNPQSVLYVKMKKTVEHMLIECPIPIDLWFEVQAWIVIYDMSCGLNKYLKKKFCRI